MRGPLSLVARLFADAWPRHETLLLEPDAFRIIETAGIRCPRRLFARDAVEAAALDYSALGHRRVVVKVVSPEVVHKSEAGGVEFVASDRDTIVTSVQPMARVFAGPRFAGCSISESVAYDSAPGGEWLVGLRWTDEFGPGSPSAPAASRPSSSRPP